MIQRRQFLGSLAAFCATTTLVPRLVQAKTDDLKWQCDLIEPVAHDHAHRSPVVTDVSLQPSGSLMAIVGDDHLVCLYDTQRHEFTQHLDRHSDWIRTARFSTAGDQLATGGNDRKLLIWSVGQWKSPVVEKQHPEAIIDVAFSRNGKQLATVGFERWLRLYDPTSGKQLMQLECACADNHTVAFSNDDRLVAAAGRCGNIRVWEAATGRKTAHFKAHRQRIRSLEFDSAGQIISAGDDQLVKITDPTNSANPSVLPRQASKLYAVKLLDGELLATAGSDNQIHIWQLSDLQELGSLKGHTGTVSCLDYSGGKLASGSYDTHVRLWSTEQHTSARMQRHTQMREGWNRKIK